MQITFITKEKIYSLRLPEKCSGKYWVEDKNNAIGQQRLIGIEADENLGKWMISESRNLKIYDKDSQRIKECCLEEGRLYLLGIGKKNEQAFLLAEAFNDNLATFEKYRIIRDITIGIGRNPENLIEIGNPYVSSYHAQISCVSGRWKLNAAPDTNGTYLNDKKVVGEAQLKPGDLISILDFKLVVGGSFIAINNPSNSVKVKTEAFGEFLVPTVEEEEYIPEEETYYYRSPHFSKEIEELKLKIDAPTTQERADSTPILLTLAPSMIMGVASFSTGIITMVNTSANGGNLMSSIPTLVMSVSMLAGMIVFPFIMRIRDKKQKLKNEEERRAKYHKYLDNVRTEITRVRLEQESVLKEKAPSVTDLASSDTFWKESLWWKRPEDSDFLSFRLGVGDEPMRLSITYPEERFSIDDDVLRNELFSFAKESHPLKDVPISISLRDCKVLGLVGDKSGVFNLLNNILLQLVLEHSYDEVKLILLCEAGDDSRLRYIRSAGHIWDNDGKTRYLAESEDDLRELSISVSRIIRERTEAEGESKKTAGPRYVVVSTGKTMESKCPFLNDVLECQDDIGFSVICAYDEVTNLPKECSAIAYVAGTAGKIEADVAGNVEKKSFVQDDVSNSFAAEAVRRMGEYHLDLQKGKYNLPEMLTFMDMFGVGKIEHLNILKRWSDNNPVRSLRVPVGVGVNGDLFWLDLHEKIHGPHGLVAGMTGSGKSEFIITYILSLAVNYHPDEVAFVLIDYKGGGLAGAFDNENYRLPHLAGTITNLDTSAVLRSILSIKSELRRRQGVFNKARTIINEGTMDIYKYQKMYRDGLVNEPMPHLFIISDEFAELKSQQPEFMEQLISTARIGRSLGVHLILATQKPAGVVNEQIWANSRFKVCLKVQDKADSMDMLKRPDAAELAETGRFWMQVGYNEIFEMGQSAWAGAPYRDSDVVSADSEDYVEVLDELGNVTDKLKGTQETKKENGKQIVRIMEYLDSLAKEEHLSVRQMWLPKLKNIITLDEIKKKYEVKSTDDGGFNGIVGELDDPYTQSQRPLLVDFAKSGNAVVYGAGGSGSELFAEALTYSLTEKYSAKRLNIYILDFGAEALRMFANAPQVCGVIQDGEDDRVETFFSYITKEMGRRKKLLSEFGGELANYNSKAENPLPNILVVLENYSHFVESYERYEDSLAIITRECTKYGIYVLMSATSDSAVRYKVKQNFVQTFALYLNDRTDYTNIFGNVGGIVPENIKGQGIIKTDEVYIFQTAHPIIGDSTEAEKVKDHCAKLRTEAESVAPKLPSVPVFISGAETVNRMENSSELPVGFSFNDYTFAKHDFSQNCILPVFSDDINDAGEMAMGAIELLAGKKARVIAVNIPEVLKSSPEVPADYFEGEPEAQIERIFDIAIERNHSYKNTGGNPTVDMTPVYVVLFGVRELLNNDAKTTHLRQTLDAMRPEYNMFFIVADAGRNSGYYSSQTWFQRNSSAGIWVGSGVTSQNSLSVRGMNRINVAEARGVGYYIVKEKADKIRLILPAGLKEEITDEQ